MPRILVKQNDRVIDQYVVEQGGFKVGRTPDNDIVLNDPSVSRQHLELKIDGNKITVTDLGSSNGTYVNGIKISRIISSKASIGVGVYNLEVVGLGHEPAPPVEPMGDNVEETMMMPMGSPGKNPLDSSPISPAEKTDPNPMGGSPGGVPGPGSGGAKRLGPPSHEADDGAGDDRKNWLERFFKKK